MTQDKQNIQNKYIVPRHRHISNRLLIIESVLAVLSVFCAVMLVSFVCCEVSFDYAPSVLPSTTSSEPAIPTEDYISEDSVNSLIAPLLYSFNEPVPENVAVDYAYFNDTVFIGDSRTKGMMMHTAMSPYDFSSSGLNVSSLQTKAYIRLPDENGTPQSYTLAEALEREKGNYKAIYVATGLNELGWPVDGFMRAFSAFIDNLEEIGGVPIYVQLIMPVTTYSSETTIFGITNEKCVQFNAELREFIAERELFMLDPAPLFTLEDGTLDPEYSYDGVHLHPKYYEILANYYRTHVVDMDNYNNLPKYGQDESEEE